jgi:hypothetical protein
MRSLLFLVLVFASACGGGGLRVATVLRTADGGVHVELQSYEGGLDRSVDLSYDAGGNRLATPAATVNDCSAETGPCVPAGGTSDTQWSLADGSTIAVDLDNATLTKTDANGQVEWKQSIGKLQTMDIIEFGELLFDDALYFTGLIGGHEWLVKVSTTSGATDWSVDLTADAG